MSERLRPRDLAVLSGESASTPRHNATVEIFDPADSGFDYARLVELVGDRISFVPRYRQRIARVPGGLANPVWVDDPDFDLGYHVRRSALPRPGSADQLFELVARIVSRPLDRHRPLWEVYFIEGLEEGKVAVLSKSHEVLVDGVHTVDLAQVLLDRSPEPRPMHHDDWRPLSAPSPTGLVAGALQDSVTDPATALETVRASVDAALRSADAVAGRAGAIAAALVGALGNRRPAGDPPLGGQLSQQRRVVTVRTALHDYLDIRRGARRQRQRRHLGHRHRRPAWLAAGPRRVDGRGQARPHRRARLGERPTTSRPRRWAARSSPTSSTCRSVSPARSSGCTRCPTRSRRTRRPAAASRPTGSPGSPASRRRPSTRSAPGSRPTRRAGASSSVSPTCPGRSRRSSPRARGCSRPIPCTPCCPGTRWRSA